MSSKRIGKPALIIEHANTDQRRLVKSASCFSIDSDENSITPKWSSSRICSRIYDGRNIDMPLTIAMLYLNDVSKEEYVSYMMPVFKHLGNKNIDYVLSDTMFQHYQEQQPRFSKHDIEYVVHIQEGCIGRDAWTCTGRLKNTSFFHFIAETDDFKYGFGERGKVTCMLASNLEELVYKHIPRGAIWHMENELKSKSPKAMTLFEIPPCVVTNVYTNLRALFRHSPALFYKKFPYLEAAMRQIRGACWVIFRTYVQRKYHPQSHAVKLIISEHCFEDGSIVAH